MLPWCCCQENLINGIEDYISKKPDSVGLQCLDDELLPEDSDSMNLFDMPYPKSITLQESDGGTELKSNHLIPNQLSSEDRIKLKRYLHAFTKSFTLVPINSYGETESDSTTVHPIKEIVKVLRDTEIQRVWSGFPIILLKDAVVLERSPSPHLAFIFNTKFQQDEFYTCMKIISTGGAGYVGIHTTVKLVEAGFNVVIVDNLSNAKEIQIKNLRSLTNREIPFYNIDLADNKSLTEVFKKHNISNVIHFAAFKSVPESVAKPLKYYDNNLVSSINLLKVMEAFNVKTLIFSSSAAVYKPKHTLLVETDPVDPINPYGRSKLILEDILKDMYIADSSYRLGILRYFNPIGTHKSNYFGDFSDQENVLPVIKRSVTENKIFKVFGGLNTPDKTGQRDYIHVEDVAEGHVVAMDHLLKNKQGICETYNLGNGKSTSVFELLRICEKIHGKPIQYELHGPRPGDASFVVADVSKAKKELNWSAKLSIEEAVESQWKAKRIK